MKTTTKKKIQMSARREKIQQSTERLKSGNALLQLKDISDSINELKKHVNENDLFKIKIYKTGFVLKTNSKKTEALTRTFAKIVKPVKGVENKLYTNAVMEMYIAEHEDTTKARATINRERSEQEKEFYASIKQLSQQI